MVAAADKASVVNVTELCTGHGDKCANTTPMWGAGWGGLGNPAEVAGRRWPSTCRLPTAFPTPGSLDFENCHEEGLVPQGLGYPGPTRHSP